MGNLECLRCGASMEYSGRERFQTGEESGYSGLLAVMTAESMLVDIYICPECGKMELFTPQKTPRPPANKSNWICYGCGEHNSYRVHACQSCGVTRAWSDDQRKKL